MVGLVVPADRRHQRVDPQRVDRGAIVDLDAQTALGDTQRRRDRSTRPVQHQQVGVAHHGQAAAFTAELDRAPAVGQSRVQRRVHAHLEHDRLRKIVALGPPGQIEALLETALVVDVPLDQAGPCKLHAVVARQRRCFAHWLEATLAAIGRERQGHLETVRPFGSRNDLDAVPRHDGAQVAGTVRSRPRPALRRREEVLVSTQIFGDRRHPVLRRHGLCRPGRPSCRRRSAGRHERRQS